KKKALAYVNFNSSTCGSDFDGSASRSVARSLGKLSYYVRTPSGKTLYDDWHATRARELHKKSVTDSQLVETRIGSGSDHTVFLNYLGIPTMLLEFNGPYGVYHSAYDDF